MTALGVGIVFEKPNGPLILDPNGRWWINRHDLGIADGSVTIEIADGHSTATITATPKVLRRLADAICAQVEGAECNTPRAAQ